jgi:hypothetical protein
MGLLDDAIREHLDLKRRRGADPSEIAREETEALGPVRRDAPEEEPPASAAGSSYADHEPAALDEPAAAYDDDLVDEDDYEDEPAVDDRDRPHRDDPPTTHDHVWAEPEDESATPPHGDPLAHQATREFSATELDEALGQHEAPAAPEREPAPVEPRREPTSPTGDADDDSGDSDSDADDDELNQTPDFLQETPEHDRLWFEQKPPKDFDF